MLLPGLGLSVYLFGLCVHVWTPGVDTGVFLCCSLAPIPIPVQFRDFRHICRARVLHGAEGPNSALHAWSAGTVCMEPLPSPPILVSLCFGLSEVF